MPKDAKVTYEGEKLFYTLDCVYNPDWKFLSSKHPNGYFYVETKGEFTAGDRRKMQNVKRCNPLEDIRLVFMQDNFLYKGSKVRYSDWAKLNGFKYHVVGNTHKYVPDEWLSECDGGFTVATDLLKGAAESVRTSRKSKAKA